MTLAELHALVDRSVLLQRACDTERDYRYNMAHFTIDDLTRMVITTTESVSRQVDLLATAFVQLEALDAERDS